MTSVTDARGAINIAKQVIQEAGYEQIQIKKTDFDEEDGLWYVHAESDETSIEIVIDAETGEVTEFDTD